MSIHFQAKVEAGFTVDSPLQPVVFPDGAVHIKGADDPQVFKYQIANVTGLSHDELFTLAMWSEVCREREEKMVLILPFLPGARMDRGVPEGTLIYAEFIATMVRPDQLITIDPHSPQWVYRYNSFADRPATVFPVERVIRNVLQDPAQDTVQNNTYQGIIAPDKGAHDRAAAAAKVMGNLPVYTAGKTRDFETGKLTGFHMEDELPDEGRFLIVDDICDGGGTFIGLAEATGLAWDRLDLWVTHGIFSKGLSTLRRNFGTIHTTDSFYAEDEYGHIAGTSWNADPDLVKAHKLVSYLYGEIDV